MSRLPLRFNTSDGPAVLVAEDHYTALLAAASAPTKEDEQSDIQRALTHLRSTTAILKALT